MFLAALILSSGFVALYLIEATRGDCPRTFPIEMEGGCYRFQTDPLKFQDAVDNCPRFGSGAKMTSVRSMSVLDSVQRAVYDFVNANLENAKFWIGFLMKDRSMSKDVKDRLWDWEYDESQIVQKEYTLWEEEGGPPKSGQSCAAIDGANDFMVKPLDCGSPRLPVICMMAKGKECKHDALPYLTYGDYCIAVLKYADVYGKVAPGCEPNKPTPYLPEMKDPVTMAAKNSFLGGGIFMYMRRMGDRFIDLDTQEEPDPDMWEDGEPRDQYDCVGLSVQTDNSLKLKTMNCDFFAASLCILPRAETSRIRVSTDNCEVKLHCFDTKVT